MALATHQLQGSCSTFPSLPSLWSRGSTSKHSVPRFYAVGSKSRIISLKYRLCSSGSKSKVFKVLAFKESSQYNDSGIESNGSKSLKTAVEVSYLQNKSEESSVESSKVQNVVSDPHTAANEIASGSLAIQNLFKNWLLLLCTPSQTQTVEKIIEEPYTTETSERQNASQTQERDEILKAVSYYFLDLDATIKIPVLLFAPMYVAVNLVCGWKVSKELAPLWILGPLFVACYIKMFRAISGLYAFSFKQTSKVVKNLPAHYSLVHDYVFHGKLKEAMRTHVFKPLADVKNISTKDLQMRLVDRYLDFIELIWPYYCRSLRFLKRMKLI